MSSNGSPAHAPRRHDIDALRAIAFSFLILYHLAMLYVHEWGWHLKSSYTTEALQVPMLFMNRWRMDLIFLISGIATAFLMRGMGTGEFVKRRLWRLLLPLLFGMAVVVPIQPYCQGVANGLVEPGFGQFLMRYYTGYPWPPKAFDGWEYGFTWNHLWYLAYLFCYTMILAAIRPLLESRAGQAAKASFTGLTGWRLLLYPAIPLVFFTLALGWRFPSTHDLINDWYYHTIYFTMMLYGWWLASSDAVWTELAGLRKRALGAALAAFAFYFLLVKIQGENPPFALAVAIWISRNVYIWLALAAILGWGHALLNRPMRWLPFATEAVYPWYILHQSLIVLIAYWLVPLKLGAVVEPMLVFAGTIGGCWLLHVGVIRRVGWLRACFGMKPVAGRKEAIAPTVAAAE
jgi:glucans biosynthesis protein C